MKKYLQSIAAAAALSLMGAGAVLADQAADIANVKAALAKVIPGAEPDRITPAPIAGFYQALYGIQVIYVSSDGRYLFQGDLFDLRARENLAENARMEGRRKIIDGLDPASMIVFKPKQTKYVVNVFTDVDCTFCQKMHSRISEYNDLGIEFRYLAYPRSGLNRPSYYKLVTVWCADNPQEAMTRAKAGEKLPNKECKNPVREHLAAGQAVGVEGTPALILANGRLLPGYREPQDLLAILEQDGN